MGLLEQCRRHVDHKHRYTGRGRDPFFLLAGRYLPEDPDAVVVDVGAGSGRFADLVELAGRYRRLHLLDGNESTVADLTARYPGAAHYRCPAPLPFADATVAYLHASHLVEHLTCGDLYGFLGEIDRVLRPGGVLVVSAPLLWERFYEDLSHVKPYAPGVFRSYLCGETAQRTARVVSADYRVEELVYRYRAVRPRADEGWGSRFRAADLLIQGVKKVLSGLGFRHYARNGYTLVLRKAS
jgi:SAM-dependent methyltransferase